MLRSILLLGIAFLSLQAFAQNDQSSLNASASGPGNGVPGKGYSLQNGEWRAALIRKDGQEIIFNFAVKDSANRKVLYIRNAGEHLLVDDVTISGDSVWIKLPFFESQLRAVLTSDGNLQGVWLKHGADNYQSVPFKAWHNQSYRFIAAAHHSVEGLSGRWNARFLSRDGKDTSIRIGEFHQNGGFVTGTFLDPTGDFRYLEGVVDGNLLKLSCFDGAHAFLFTATAVNDSTIADGRFYSGASSLEYWTAYKDAKATLPDEFSLTKWKKDAGPIRFTFKDIDGKNVSLNDTRFRNKVIVIQIMGSWCPNCMDETQFLSPFYDQYHSKGVEVIGLAYERTTDFARSQSSLRSFQQRFQVKYPILITGVTVGDPKRAEKTLPQIEGIVGFPTTIFLDRKGNIYKIHTGFNGPGTGIHYEDQKKEFCQTVDRLLAE